MSFEKSVTQKIRENMYEVLGIPSSIGNLFYDETAKFAAYQDMYKEERECIADTLKEHINKSQKSKNSIYKENNKMAIEDMDEVTVKEKETVVDDDSTISTPLTDLVETYNYKTGVWTFSRQGAREDIISIHALNPNSQHDKKWIAKGYKFRMMVQKDGGVGYPCMKSINLAKIVARFLLVG